MGKPEKAGELQMFVWGKIEGIVSDTVSSSVGNSWKQVPGNRLQDQTSVILNRKGSSKSMPTNRLQWEK